MGRTFKEVLGVPRWRTRKSNRSASPLLTGRESSGATAFFFLLLLPLLLSLLGVVSNACTFTWLPHSNSVGPLEWLTSTRGTTTTNPCGGPCRSSPFCVSWCTASTSLCHTCIEAPGKASTWEKVSISRWSPATAPLTRDRSCAFRVKRASVNGSRSGSLTSYRPSLLDPTLSVSTCPTSADGSNSSVWAASSSATNPTSNSP
mmetsp:Transcript_67101/g.125389  ORF Transcript_67101/g.125389 Transcript_67101/m.125389 type:complete len:203 (-) Transcript_67101:15-623(-)